MLEHASVAVHHTACSAVECISVGEDTGVVAEHSGWGTARTPAGTELNTIWRV
jgi:hypothetical protein